MFTQNRPVKNFLNWWSNFLNLLLNVITANDMESDLRGDVKLLKTTIFWPFRGKIWLTIGLTQSSTSTFVGKKIWNFMMRKEQQSQNQPCLNLWQTLNSTIKQRMKIFCSPIKLEIYLQFSFMYVAIIETGLRKTIH